MRERVNAVPNVLLSCESAAPEHALAVRSVHEDGSVINGADGHGGGRIGAWERNDEGTKGRGGERWLLLAFVPPRVKS